MARLNEVPFVKGHGTGNDFVIIPDVDGHLDLTDDQVRWLCDRHVGVGGNGVLRVVRTDQVPEFADFAPVAEFFMDYRNADGTVAEMCGNGIRVFVRYLDATGLVTDNDVVVGDPATSGHHGRIETRNGVFWISDLGSTNGTLVNGEPVLEKQLAHGDVIAIGQNVIRFTLEK